MTARDRLLDNGLTSMVSETDTVFLCTTDPVSYAAAVASHVGQKSGSRGSMFFAISSPVGGGRQASIASFSDGSTTANGTANYIAVGDSVLQNLFITEALAQPQAVQSGNAFSLISLQVILGASTQPQATNLTTGSPVISPVQFSIPLLTALDLIVSSPPVLGTPDLVWIGSGWFDVPIAVQTGSFTVEVDVIPSVLAIDASVGLAMGPSVAYATMACVVLFTTGNVIQVRNGSSYAATAVQAYAAGQQFHIRMSGNVVNHTYSVWATPLGQSEVQIANNYSFRTEQLGVTQIDNFVRSIADIGSISFFGLKVGFVAVPITVASPDIPQLALNNKVGVTGAAFAVTSPTFSTATLILFSTVTNGQQINTTNTGRAGAAAAGIANYSSTTNTLSGTQTYSTNQTIRNTIFTGPVYVTAGIVTFEFCSFTYTPPAQATGLRVYNNGGACNAICNWCTFDTGLRGSNVGFFESTGLQAGERGTGNAPTSGCFLNAYRCSIQGYGNCLGFESWYSSGSLIQECYIANPTLGGATHADCIEIASSDNVTIQRCRVELPTANDVDFYQGGITNNNGFGNTPNGNPIVIDANYFNGGISPIMCRGNYVTGGVNPRNRFTNNYFGDNDVYGRNCDFNSMDVTYDLGYALSNPNVIYWEQSNVWTPNGEGVTNQVSWSGNAQATSPHVGGGFVSAANFYGGEVWIWSGHVVGPSGPLTLTALTLTVSSPVLNQNALNNRVTITAANFNVSPPIFAKVPLNGRFLLTASPFTDTALVLGRPLLTTSGAGSWLDGLAGAPTGTAQYPSLLNGYFPSGQSAGRNKSNGRQPPFNVPGIDYRVGINTGVSLVTPTSGNLPAGSSISGATVTVTGANVTLDGYNFGDGHVEMAAGASNLIVRNSRWTNTGANIAITVRGNGCRISYCEIDGGGGDKGQGVVTYFTSTGAQIIEYSRVGNAGVDLISQLGGGSGSLNIQYSILEKCGLAGGHPDVTQLLDANWTVRFWNNLVYTPTAATQGLMTDAGTQFPSFTSQNTLIGVFGNEISCYTANMSGAQRYVLHDNYTDRFAGSSGALVYHNAQTDPAFTDAAGNIILTDGTLFS